MTGTACLHIQDRETDAVRVVELGGGSVRIGRSAFCDIRLADPALARVECVLTPQGDGWLLVPEAPTASVWYDGEPLDGPIAIPADAEFRVGNHWLNLRTLDPSPLPPDDADEGDPIGLPPHFRFHEPPESLGPDGDEDGEGLEDDSDEEAPAAPVVKALAVPEPEPKPAAEAVPAPPAEAGSGRASPARAAATRPEVRRWESRWRAAAETLKRGAATPAPAPRTPTTPLRAAPARPTAPSPFREPRAYTAPARSYQRPKAAGVSPLARTTPPTRPNSPSEVGPTPADPLEEAKSATLPDRAEAAPAEPDAPPAAEPDAPAVFEEPASAGPGSEPAAQSVAGPDDDDDDFEAEREPARVLGAARRGPVAAPSRPWAADEPEVIDVESWAAEAPPLNDRDGTTGATAFAGDSPPPEALAPHDAHRPRVGESREPHEFDEGHRPAFDEVWHDPRPFVTDTVAAQDPPGAGRGRAEAGGGASWSVRDPWGGDEPFAGGQAEGGGRSKGSGGRPGAVSPRDWPSVIDILAAQQPRRSEPAAATQGKPARTRPVPTEAREPRQWSLPLWLAWLPATALAVGLGSAGLGLGWVWTVENQKAGMVARRLDPASGVKAPLPEGVEPGAPAWWRSTADQLAVWAAYLDRDENDPGRVGQGAELLKRAAEVSPLSASGRYARAHGLGVENDPPGLALARALGQTRDVATLTETGLKLLEASKPRPAFDAFKAALAMAAGSGLDRPSAPVLDGARVQRFALPSEDLIAPVVRVMASSKAWTFHDWKAALPAGTAAPLAAARVLRERQDPEADAALELALAVEESVAASEGGRAARAVRLAARAEALALKGRFREAVEAYKLAVEQTPSDEVRRSWWLNLADLAGRLGDDAERLKALELAKSEQPKDEVTRYAVELQKETGAAASRSVARTGDADPRVKAASTSAP